MKRIIALISVVTIVALNIGFNSRVYSQNENNEVEEKVVEKIEAEEVAEELAAMSDGEYVKGEAPPELESGEVALPIIDEETGDILGYVVADQAKLVSVLNEVGLTEVANALAAMEAGAAAGATVAAGISTGTLTWIAIGVAAVGLGLGLGGGGGGGGGGDGGGVTPPPAH